MRSIGVTKSSGPQPYASQTSAHNGFYAMNRALSRNLTPGASIPKVGVMQSSQRTQLRSVKPAAGILGRTDFGGAQTTVVNDARRRVRNAGSCAPKKKGAVQLVLPPPVPPVPPIPPLPANNTLIITIRAVNAPGSGQYTLVATPYSGTTDFVSSIPESRITGFQTLDISNISQLRIIQPTGSVRFSPALYTPGGLIIPFQEFSSLSADIGFERLNVTTSKLQFSGGNLDVSRTSTTGFFVIRTSTPIEPPLNITVATNQSEYASRAFFVQYTVSGSNHFYRYYGTYAYLYINANGPYVTGSFVG